MRSATLLLLGLAFSPPALAQDWATMATISNTMSVEANRVCIGESSRGDLGCPTYAPTVSPTGTLNVSGGIETTNVSLTTINGISASTLGNGGSIPTGAIMAFDLAACPTGWSEYTAARGRFLRGIDNTGTNDSVRAAGNTQEDAFQGHKHQFSRSLIAVLGADGLYDARSNIADSRDGNYYDGASIMNAAPVTDGTNGTPRTAAETRPKNVAVLYCRKD